jgi:hypothetical protein
MATAGAAIGLEKAAADAITAAAVPWPVAAVMRVAAGDRTQRQHITMVADRFAATLPLPVVEMRVQVNPMRQLPGPMAVVNRTRHQRITAVVVVPDIRAVVDSKVVVDMPAAVAVVMLAVAVEDMKAADTSNR